MPATHHVILVHTQRLRLATLRLVDCGPLPDLALACLQMFSYRAVSTNPIDGDTELFKRRTNLTDYGLVFLDGW